VSERRKPMVASLATGADGGAGTDWPTWPLLVIVVVIIAGVVERGSVGIINGQVFVGRRHDLHPRLNFVRLLVP
jgi:hypothetical protein